MILTEPNRQHRRDADFMCIVLKNTIYFKNSIDKHNMLWYSRNRQKLCVGIFEENTFSIPDVVIVLCNVLRLYARGFYRIIMFDNVW